MARHGSNPPSNPTPQEPSPRDKDGQHPDVSKPGDGDHRKPK
ncbi:hypothetical protein AB0M57_35230 [Streptomyces sp. NPDC051597]